MTLRIVGGGFFTGRYHSITGAVEPGSRFDPQRNQGRVRTFYTYILPANS